MREIKNHIIHCSDSDFGCVREIRRWHQKRGFRDVGYHFIIRQDGEIEIGRPLDEIGAHCKGFNTQSIGTCLIGRQNFSKHQFKALKKLHNMLEKLFDGLTLQPHGHFNKRKTCPNFNPVERVLK